MISSNGIWFVSSVESNFLMVYFFYDQFRFSDSVNLATMYAS